MESRLLRPSFDQSLRETESRSADDINYTITMQDMYSPDDYIRSEGALMHSPYVQSVSQGQTCSLPVHSSQVSPSGLHVQEPNLVQQHDGLPMYEWENSDPLHNFPPEDFETCNTLTESSGQSNMTDHHSVGWMTHQYQPFLNSASNLAVNASNIASYSDIGQATTDIAFPLPSPGLTNDWSISGSSQSSEFTPSPKVGYYPYINWPQSARQRINEDIFDPYSDLARRSLSRAPIDSHATSEGQANITGNTLDWYANSASGAQGPYDRETSILTSGGQDTSMEAKLSSPAFATMIIQPPGPVGMVNSPPQQGNAISQARESAMDTQQPLVSGSGGVRVQEACDAFIVRSRLEGKSYRTIKLEGGFAEAESTLRGRYRNLVKPRHHRLRKPSWTSEDIKLLRKAVRSISAKMPPLANGFDVRKFPWKHVVKYMEQNGASYPFANATLKKKWLELVAQEGGADAEAEEDDC